MSEWFRERKKTVTIPAPEAYGEHRQDLVEEIRRNELPQDIDPQVGSQLEVTRQDGSVFHVMVTDATELTVTLDANHPLAGRELTFDINLLEVRQQPPQ